MNVREFYKKNPWLIQATLVIIAFDLLNYYFSHQWLDATKFAIGWGILVMSLMLNTVAGRYIKGKEDKYYALNLSKLLSPTFGGTGLLAYVKGDILGAILFLALPHAAFLYFFLYALWTAEPTPEEADSERFVLNSQHQ